MKHQVPNTSAQKNFQPQPNHPVPPCLLSFKSWCFSGAWILLLGSFLLTGCLSRKPLNKETFAFTLPQPAHASASANAPILTMRLISVAAQFDSPSLTYRTGEFSYERDPYAGFLVSPGASMADPIRARLANSGKFSSVPALDSSVRGTLDLEISVSQLYGDFRNKSEPAAVLEMHFVLYKPKQAFGKNAATDIIFQKTYSRRIPIKARTANAVMAAMNEALDQIVSEFAGEAPVQ